MKLKIIIFLLLTCVLLPVIIWSLLAKYPHDVRTYTGITLIIPSFVLLVIAHFQLGRSLAATAEAKELVTTGLYAKIRHPIYVFGELMFMGFALVNGSIVLSVFCAMLPVWIFWRVRRENRILEEQFGDAYRAYRAQVWF